MSSSAMLSSVADSLYWMSRYLERVEHTARLLIVNLNMTLDVRPVDAERRWQHLFETLNVPEPDEPITDYMAMQHLTFDPENTNSIFSCISAARENARQVRAQISSEMWEHLNGMYLAFKSNDLDEIWNEGPFNFLRQIRNGCHLFEGITDSTMNHGEGWHFIQAGRFIERAIGIANLLVINRDVFNNEQGDEVPDHYLDLLSILKSCTAFEAYCKIYTANLVPERVAELLLLNEEFPHSVHFSVERVQNALGAIADATDRRKTIRTNRIVGRLKAELNFDMIDEVMSVDLVEYLKAVQRKCADIHQSVYDTYIAYPIQNTLVYQG